MDSVKNTEGSVLTLTDCHVILRNCLKTERVKAISFSVKPLSDITGYMGKHFALEIQYSSDSKIQNKTVFAKSITDVPNAFVEYFPEVHLKEVGTYNFVKEFCAVHGDELNVAAQLYLDHDSSKTMVLEDLRADGFLVLHDGSNINLDHIQVACDALARFHAMTFIHEHESSERLGQGSRYSLLEDHSDWLQEGVFSRDHSWGYRLTMSGFKGLSALVDVIPVDEQLPVDSFKAGIRSLADKFFDLLGDGGKHFRSVLNHGDLWSQNMMFAYDKQGKPDRCRLIDFQLVRYAPPALDLMVLLCSIMDKDTFKTSNESFIDHYFKCLSTHLSNAGLDIQNELPKQEFLNSCDVYKPCAILIKTFPRTVLAAGGEKFEKLCGDRAQLESCLFGDRTQFVLESFREMESYREELNVIMNDVRDIILKGI